MTIGLHDIFVVFTIQSTVSNAVCKWSCFWKFDHPRENFEDV